MRIIFQETWTALKTWPDAKQWLAALRLAIPVLAIVGFIGFLGGWAHWYPVDRWQEAVSAVFVAFFVSAIPAELVFRGVLLSALAKYSPRWGAWLATVAFALSYPIYVMINETKWNGVLAMPSFCFAMLVFGIILSHIRIVSRSLWPVILIHGVAAVIWMLVLGRQFY
ncbi:MAG: CPBP family glutamic-type intramembrane protease [Parasphingorhabdus sp.]|uniref:CPBP family glutamic-type intramembrane protease n=1 Tax=Parasphingorhabdus sp. TaxID=2709688 RepID=UPI0032987760